MSVRIWLAVASVVVAAACGGGGGDDDAADVTATTTRPEVVATTEPIPVSPFGPEETEYLLGVLDDVGARELTDDASWLGIVDSACEFLDGVTEPSTFSGYLSEFVRGVDETGKDGMLAAEGLVETTKIACTVVGFSLAVSLEELE